MLEWGRTSRTPWEAMDPRVGSTDLKEVIPGSQTTMLCPMPTTPVQEWEEA